MSEKKYQDKQFLIEEYKNTDRSLKDMGELCGVADRTISYWCDKHDIETKPSGGERPIPRFYTELESSASAGYETIRTKHNRTDYRVKLHRLLAVAEYGFDEVKDMTVHHKNGIKWDNRAENIELLPNSKHAKLHAEEQRENGNPFWEQR